MEKKFKITNDEGNIICDNIINLGVAANLYIFLTDHYTDDSFKLERISIENIAEDNEEVSVLKDEDVEVIDEN